MEISTGFKHRSPEQLTKTKTISNAGEALFNYYHIFPYHHKVAELFNSCGY
jgi:hypothetical protein